MAKFNKTFVVANMNLADDFIASAAHCDDRSAGAIDELRTRPQWVCWKLVQRGEGKPTKPPVNPHTGMGASVTNHEHWSSWDKAVAARKRLDVAGVGFVLTDDDEFTGIDLDRCRDPITGIIAPWAQEIIDLAETYAEVSPSGTGLRFFARGKVSRATKSDRAHVEIYGKDRYLTVTGQHVEGTPGDIREAPRTIAALLARVKAMEPQRDDIPDKPSKPLNITMSRPAGDREKVWAGIALDATVSELAQTGSGGRNAALNASAYRLGRIVARGWLSQADVVAALEGACQRNGLWKEDGPRQVRASLMSGLKSGAAQPHEDLEDRPQDDEAERLGAQIAAVYAARANMGEGRAEAPAGSATVQEPTNLLEGFVFDGDAPSVPPPMLVKRLIPFDGIAFVGGQSGAGKTFVAIDMAVSLASGEPFFGHKVTERVGVAIFAAEGFSTIANRVAVARNHKAQGEILPITWLGAVPNLADEREIKAMVQKLRAVDAKFRATHGVRLGAVICDTLAASFSLTDENSNSEAAKAIRAMKALSDALSVVVLPIHHFGKAAETGLRGASGWRAGCDAVLSVLANRDETTGQCSSRRVALTKSRVGEEGWVVPFDLRFVEIGTDEDGEAFGACYIEPGKPEDAIITTTGPREKAPPRYAKVYLDAFGIVIGDKGRKVRPFGSEGSEVNAVDREAIRCEFYRLWAADGADEKARASAKCKAFSRGETWAADHRLTASYEVGKQHLVWLLKDSNQ